MRIIRPIAAGAVALGAIALTALPASAYTSDAFGWRCSSSTGAYSVMLEGNWHRSSTTVNLSGAGIWNNSGRAYDITATHWEDLTTGTVYHGPTGYLPNGKTLGLWYPSGWFPKTHNIKFTASGYADTNHSQVITNCQAIP